MDESKIKLFESDEESDEENSNDDFKIRPEYQGPHGLEMLEMNSQLSKRFRLDERFAEDFDPEDFNKDEEKEVSSEISDEKKKNMRILESVLGHEVSKLVKPVDKSFSIKQFIRFDPEDENASKFLKTPENVQEKPKKAKKKKEIVEEKPEDNIIPISAVRYMEVDPNLKDILNSSTPFTFSEKFNLEHEETTLDLKNDTFSKSTKEIEIQEDDEEPRKKKLFFEKKIPKFNSSAQKPKFKFFITEDDPRLKEGVEFFKRPKPLEELRVEWQKRRESLLELFRRKRRSSQRSHTTRVRTVQMKNMIRRNNFKR